MASMMLVQQGVGDIDIVFDGRNAFVPRVLGDFLLDFLALGEKKRAAPFSFSGKLLGEPKDTKTFWIQEQDQEDTKTFLATKDTSKEVRKSSRSKRYENLPDSARIQKP